MESVRIVNSQEDGLDRLLVSFKDAKVSHSPTSRAAALTFTPLQIALLEWSDTLNDLLTVSIHTYERAPQMVSHTLDSKAFYSSSFIVRQPSMHLSSALNFVQTRCLDVLH